MPKYGSVNTSVIADQINSGYWAWDGYGGTQPRYWENPNPGNPTEISVNTSGLSSDYAALAVQAFSVWEDVANIHITYTTGSADINFDSGGSGVANTSQTTFYDTLTDRLFITGATVHVSSDWSGGPSGGVYSYFYQTLVHEIGHALGLGHSGDYNGGKTNQYYNTDSTLFANDTWQWSIMSYNDQSQYGGTADDVITPEMADIYAIQSTYGAATTRTGDTTYGFNSTEGSFYNFASYSGTPAFTIYDSGGNDTFDCSGYYATETIDLRAGNWSSVGGYTDNIAIYYNVVIENAVGGNGTDTIYGNDADNKLYGGAGNDTLVGSAGADLMEGGTGSSDTAGGVNTVDYSASAQDIILSLYNGVGYSGDAAGDTLSHIQNVIGSAFGDDLIGDDNANALYGGGGDDTLVGYNGADHLDGGNGVNTANYYGSTAVRVDLAAGTGSGGEAKGDTFVNIQNVQGSNGGNDVLIGTSGRNVLDGYAGNDFMRGNGGGDDFDGGGGTDTVSYDWASGAANVFLNEESINNGAAAGDTMESIENIIGSSYGDILSGDDADNVLRGNRGNDYITGGGGVNLLDGGVGDDELSSGAGQDAMVGGDGVDTATYELAQSGVTADLLNPRANTGWATGDTYQSVENLSGSGLADILRGDDHANVINGNGGDDRLYGRGGSDTYDVDSSADKVFEAADQGTDRVVTSGSYTLIAGQSIEALQTSDAAASSALTLVGNALTQKIVGNAGDDVIKSGGGGDTLVGLGGNDTFYVSASSDRAIEAAGGGRDRVISSVDYRLGAGQSIEVLMTADAKAHAGIDLTGNEQDQTIIGDAGANVIDGMGGRDRLEGMGGHDTFLFDSGLRASNVDTIADFGAVKDDLVALAHGIFTAAGPVGTLAASAFHVGTFASSASVRIVYNSTSGALLYDADGTGSGVAMEFAKLTAGLAMTNTDFKVV